MMKMNEAEIMYYENNVMKMIELPYEGETLSMIIILPLIN